MISMLKKVFIKGFVILPLFLTFSAIAEDKGSAVTSSLDKLDPILDYRIGAQITPGNYRRLGRPAIDVNYPNAGWNIGASCSGWSADAGVSGLLNNAKSQFNRLQRQLVNSMTGFVTQLPMLLIQREDPGLYELLNTTLLNGEDLFEARVATCRQMSERFVKAGSMGDIQDTSFWMDFSEQEKEQRESGGDLTKVIDEAEENKGEGGVIGMGGERCGGKNQPVCEPVSAAVKDGYDRLKKAAADDYGDDVIPWHLQIWSSAEEASKWVKRVVGDVRYATCKDCNKLEQSPGIGVYDDIANGADVIRDELLVLVDHNDIPSAKELRRVSSNDLMLSEAVVFALRAETVQQGSFLYRLSEDISVLRTVDKLLAARRLLIAGKTDPNFNSTAKNIEIIDAKIRMIADEIAMIKEELELKKVARGDTVTILLTRYESRRRLNPDNGYQDDVKGRLKEGLKQLSGG